MKIKIETDRIQGFYWSIHTSSCNIADGYAKTHPEAEKNALTRLEKIAKNIDTEIRMRKMKTYQKKPFKAFQWNFSMKHIDGVRFHNGRYSYNGLTIFNDDWILPETNEVVSNENFQKFFEEVQ